MTNVLIEILIAQGISGSQARHIIDHLETLKRDQIIYELRAQGLPCRAIAERFGITRFYVHRVVREQLKLRRAG